MLISKLYEIFISKITSLLFFLIKLGPVPRHLAIIMDGNRRWARKKGLAPSEGHPWGSKTLNNALRWCYDSGIQQLTLFAFSIENYKRPEEERRKLFALTREKLEEMLDSRDIIQRYRIRVTLVGDLSLLPEDLQHLMHSVMKETAKNEGPRLNICFSYTARDEICTALVHMLDDLLEQKLSLTDVNASRLDEYISHGQKVSKDCLAPDIILRTSGETRLSDFLLWQSSYSLLYFSTRMWPDFGILDFVRLLFWYQHHWKEYQKLHRRQGR
ncbi:hypothetical protein GpartN1_g2693.t1 [Galdieria partita]|uniref:Alkyl transferase n=1 Tax=Galdieria partita TaxID=83374 RepID=A0A9C7PWD4_9RHOD|nr:hypothetical protein GpartN1_g2693.t1 [Galdieria partita]